MKKTGISFLKIKKLCDNKIHYHSITLKNLSPGATAVDGNLLKKFRFLVFFSRHFRLAFVPRWRRSLFISCPALSSSYSENSQCRTMPGVCVRGST